MTGIPASAGGARREPHSLFSERQCLLPSPTQEERIAALQPHDALAAARGADHQPMDRLLPDRLATSAFAHEEPLRPRRELQRFRGDQGVVEDEVRLREPADCLLGQEVGISRPRADQRHETRHRGVSPILLSSRNGSTPRRR